MNRINMLKSVVSAMAVLSAVAAWAAPVFVSDSGEATLTIDDKGRLASLKEKLSGRELVEKPEPFVAAVGPKGGLTFPVRASLADGNALTFAFTSGGRIELRAERFSGGWTFTVAAADCVGAQRFRFASVAPACRRYAGAFANMMSDEDSAVVLRAYDVDLSMSVPGRRRLVVESDGVHPFAGRRFGLSAGRRAAIREMLKEMTRVAGVPQTNAGGAWSLEAKENLGSYLLAHPGAETLDEWLALADVGGFDIFHYEGWQRGYGHYAANPNWFPNGDADLERAVAKIRAHGFRMSAHTYTGFISMTDEWVTPKPHPDLMTYTGYTLARPFEDGDTELYVNEEPDKRHAFEIKYFSTGNILRLGDELLQYTGLSREKPYRFTGVSRAAFKTRKGGPYAAGTRCDYVFQRFYCVHPKIGSKLLDEVARTVMGRIDRFGFDRVYWDASDATGPYDTAVMRRKFAAACDQSKRPLQAESSSLGPHNWWFHSTVGAWDYPRWSVKRFHDTHLTYCEAECVKSNLMGPQLGWYSIASHVQPLTPARDQRHDEVEYFASRNAGANVPMSVHGNFYSSYATNPIPWRCLGALTLVGWYERFRMADVFTDEARAAMKPAGSEFRLRLDDRGEWTLASAPCREHRAGTPETRTWREEFPEACAASVRVEALYGAESEDSPRAMSVLSAADVPALKVSATKGVTVACAAKDDAEKGRVIALSAKNGGKVRANATCSGVRLEIPRPYRDISANGKDGAFVFWVKGDGSGAILNFMPESPSEYLEARSEHYIRLDFTGWRRIVASLRERDSEDHENYYWPYDWHIHEYPVYRDCVDTKHLNCISLYFNGIPEGREVRAEIGEVRYVPSVRTSVERGRVTVNGTALEIPFALASGEAAQLEAGVWSKFDDRGELLEARRSDARADLVAGANAFAFDGGRAHVTVFGRGRPFKALKDRSAWSDDARRRLAFEAAFPEVYRPSCGLAKLAPLVARTGETASLSVSVYGRIEKPTFVRRTWFGLRKEEYVFPVKMTVNDMLTCEDGIHWKQVRRLMSGKRKTVAEGTLPRPLPRFSGTLDLSLTSSDPSDARATVAFVKHY